MNMLQFYTPRPERPHRESEREYLLRVARQHELEERRQRRSNVLRRLTRRGSGRAT